MGKKESTGVKIPVLEKDSYSHWKVKMHLHLLSLDTSYIKCIENGPHVPMKVVTGVNSDGSFAPDRVIPKPVSEFSEEDETEVHKDKKVMNILFNGIDKDMFDNVINSNSAKEIWDTLQILCEGTEQVRENKQQLLIQQYEHFYHKQGESLNDIYSRFQKLLNGLKLHGRVYTTKDANLKFLRSLPKEWKNMTVSLRHSDEFKKYSLEQLYGVLKTYELEIQQDEEVERSQKKEKSVALVAGNKEDVKKMAVREEAVTEKSAPNRVCEGSTGSSKGKGKAVESDDSDDDELNEFEEYLALLSKRFSKLKFKRNSNWSKSKPQYNRDGQSDKNLVDRSKFKCFNCGVAGHFSNECRKPKTEKNPRSSDNVDYKKKYFELLRQKEKAFITEERDWADGGDDSDEEVLINLALMADSEEQEASSSIAEVVTSNISELSKDDCNLAVNEMTNELYNLHVSLKSLTKENAKIRQTNAKLMERNDWLEKELLSYEQCKKDYKTMKDELLVSLEREKALKIELEKELETVKKWSTAPQVFDKVKATRNFNTNSKDKSDGKRVAVDEQLSTDSEPSTDKEEIAHPLIGKDNECYPLTEKASTNKKVKKLSKKYCHLDNFTKEEASKTVKTDKVEKANIGHLSYKQLKDKLEKVKDKQNRNGKVGVNKHTDFTPDRNAVRKTCVKCGSSNHLSANCKTACSSMPMPVLPTFAAQNAHMHAQLANMSLMHNPYMNMPNMQWSMPYGNNLFAQNMPYINYANCIPNEHINVPMVQKPTPKVKVDLNTSKPKVDKKVVKPKAKANVGGPKSTWVPKST